MVQKYLTRAAKTCERCHSSYAPTSNAQRYCLTCGNTIRLEKARIRNKRYLTPSQRVRRNQKLRDRYARELQFLTDKEAQQICLADPTKIKTIAGDDRIVCLGTRKSPCWFLGKVLDGHVQQHFPASSKPVAAFLKEWNLPSRFSLHSKTFSLKKSAHTKHRLKNQDYRYRLAEKTRNSWKNPKTAKARSRGLRAEWANRTPEDKDKRLAGIRQSNADYIRFRESQRLPRKRGGRKQGAVAKGTRAAVLIAARQLLLGENKYQMAPLVHPRNHRDDSYRETKQTFRRHHQLIETERVRLAALSESEITREMMMAMAVPR